MTKEKLIVDIDGTIARVKKMAKWPVENEEDRLNFIHACKRCEPITRIVSVVQQLSPFYDVVLLTARPEFSRQATMEWLLSHNIIEGDIELIMRPDYDTMNDDDLKIALLFEAGYSPKDVGLIFDDNAGVVSKLQAAGYNCALVKDI